jgi:hypothetical protein
VVKFTPRPLSPEGKNLSTRGIRWAVGPRAGMDVWGHRRIDIYDMIYIC